MIHQRMHTHTQTSAHAHTVKVARSYQTIRSKAIFKKAAMNLLHESSATYMVHSVWELLRKGVRESSFHCRDKQRHLSVFQMHKTSPEEYAKEIMLLREHSSFLHLHTDVAAEIRRVFETTPNSCSKQKKKKRGGGGLKLCKTLK